jgi:hypothetical protein
LFNGWTSSTPLGSLMLGCCPPLIESCEKIIELDKYKEEKQNLEENMKDKTISNVITLRIRSVDLLDRLQEEFLISNLESFNEFLNNKLSEIVFRKDNDYEILDRLEKVADKVNAIYEMGKELYEKQQ